MNSNTSILTIWTHHFNFKHLKLNVKNITVNYFDKSLYERQKCVKTVKVTPAAFKKGILDVTSYHAYHAIDYIF